jgi:RNA polymerase sigma-70 factor (ECF subfamily)
VSELSDDELMAKVANHCKSALNLLVNRHLGPLYAYALRLSGNSSSAEDLVQDTWLKVWTHANSYRSDTVKLRTWLYKVLHNKFIDDHRKQSKFANPSEFAEQALIAPSSSDPEVQNQLAQEKSSFEQLLAEVPHNQRAALLLVHGQGFAGKEVAQILDLSESAARSLLARGRNTMRKAYTKKRKKNNEY